MLPNRLNDDPVALDFESVRERLQTLATQAFPAWTDHESAGFGNVLLDLFAFCVEVLGYAIEYQGRESRLTTANRRANVLAHARMLGYKPRGATAARTLIRFSLEEVANEDVAIPTGYAVRTKDLTPPEDFRVSESATISKGQREATVSAEAAIANKLVVDANGLPNQTVILPRAPYLDGSCVVTTGGGSSYREIPNFLDSTANDLHYEVSVDGDGQATLLFGSGTMGAAPRGMLTIDYKTGGGERGNVEAHSLTVADTPLLTTSGQPVAFHVTNPSAAQGGADRESNEDIKRNAPESLRVAHRTITREDFEINARKVPGVARALMLTSNEEPAIEENTGHLFVVPHGGGALTEDLRQRVLRQVTHDYPCTLTFQVDVRAPTYVTVDIEAEVEIRHDGPKLAIGYEGPSREEADEILVAKYGSIDRLGQLALAERFQISNRDGSPNDNVDFGFYARGAASGRGDVAWSDIVATLCAVPEIRKVVRVTLNGAENDIPLAPYEFPVIGRVLITPPKGRN